MPVTKRFPLSSRIKKSYGSVWEKAVSLGFIFHGSAFLNDHDLGMSLTEGHAKVAEMQLGPGKSYIALRK